MRRKIAEGIAAFSFETLVSTLLAALSAALAFRYVSVADYGRMTVAFTFYATGTIFLDFGLGPVFTAEIARSRGAGLPDHVKLFTLAYLGLELLMGSALALVYQIIGSHQANEYAPLWPIMGLYLLATALTNVGVTVFHAFTLYRRQAAQSVARGVARLALLLTLPLWWRGQRLIGLAITSVGMEACVAVVSLILARDLIRQLWPVRLPDHAAVQIWSTLKEQGFYASILVPAKKVQDQLPVWVLTSTLGEAAVGLYAAAAGGYSMALSFFRSVETTMFPIVSEFAEQQWSVVRRAVVRIQRYSLWLACLAVASGVVMAPLLIHLLAGQAYANAANLLRVLLLLLLVYGLGQIQRPLFYALRAQRLLFGSYLVGIILYAVALYLGIRLAGLLGAMIGIVVAEAAAVYVRYRLLQRINVDMQPPLKELLSIQPEDFQLLIDGLHYAQRVAARLQRRQI